MDKRKFYMIIFKVLGRLDDYCEDLSPRRRYLVHENTGRLLENQKKCSAPGITFSILKPVPEKDFLKLYTAFESIRQCEDNSMQNDLSHTREVQMANNHATKSIMTNMDQVMELTIEKWYVVP